MIDLIVLRMAVLFGCGSVGYDGLCIDIYGLVLVVLLVILVWDYIRTTC